MSHEYMAVIRKKEEFNFTISSLLSPYLIDEDLEEQLDSAYIDYFDPVCISPFDYNSDRSFSIHVTKETDKKTLCNQLFETVQHLWVNGENYNKWIWDGEFTEDLCLQVNKTLNPKFKEVLKEYLENNDDFYITTLDIHV